MKAEEFLMNMWNKCIWMVHEDVLENILMIYDPIHTRKMKLNSLYKNINVEFKKSDDTKILFYQEYTSGHLFVNYNIIWSVIEDKYNLNYQGTRDLIRTTLLEGKKLNHISPRDDWYLRSVTTSLNDNDLKQLKPEISIDGRLKYC